MRIILTLLFIANVVTFADVTIREFWQIIVPEEFFNDDIRYEQIDPSEPPITAQCAAFFDYKSLNPKHGPYFDFDDVLPLSVDTNVYFGAEIEESEGYRLAINLMILSTATASYYDMINDLFGHYYECDYLNVSREVVDDYIQKISSTLDTSYKSNFICDYLYDENHSIFYYATGRTGPVDIPHGIYEVLDKLNSNDSIPDVLFKRNSVHQYQGRPYTLMDMQGRILEQGIFKSQQLHVNQHAILKIHGHKPKVLK